MTEALKDELMASFRNHAINDIMKIEVKDDYIECRQVAGERRDFEKAVCKLADLWRPIVKQHGLFIGHGRAGVRFLDHNCVGIYFGKDSAAVKIKPNMNK